MPAPHALYSKMLAERTASRNVLVLFYFIYLQGHASPVSQASHDTAYFASCGILLAQYIKNEIEVGIRSDRDGST